MCIRDRLILRISSFDDFPQKRLSKSPKEARPHRQKPLSFLHGDSQSARKKVGILLLSFIYTQSSVAPLLNVHTLSSSNHQSTLSLCIQYKSVTKLVHGTRSSLAHKSDSSATGAPPRYQSSLALVTLDFEQQHTHTPLFEVKSFLPFRATIPQIFSPCLLYTSPSPRDATLSRMPSSA